MKTEGKSARTSKKPVTVRRVKGAKLAPPQRVMIVEVKNGKPVQCLSDDLNPATAKAYLKTLKECGCRLSVEAIPFDDRLAMRLPRTEGYHLTENCPPDIDAEARALFPDLPYTITTADGKELTGSVMDMRQELYRLRRIKGDMLTAGNAAPQEPSTLPELPITLCEADGRQRTITIPDPRVVFSKAYIENSDPGTKCVVPAAVAPQPSGKFVNEQLYAVLIEKNGECFLDDVAIPNVTDNTLSDLHDAARAYTDPRNGMRAVVVAVRVKIPMPQQNLTYLPVIDLDRPNAAPEVIGVDYAAEQRRISEQFNAVTPEVK